jgi:hypothetical protein
MLHRTQAAQVQEVNDVWAPPSRHKKVPPWSGPWCKEQGEQAWKRRANDSLPIPRQGKERLRWLGMEEEAQGLQNELGRRRATAADSVLATAAETD